MRRRLRYCRLSFLAVVLIPGVGSNRGGSQAWLGIGSFGIQPSEFAKLGLVIFLAHYLADAKDRMQSFCRGFLPPLLLALAAVGLIMLEPDLGQSVVIMGTTVIMLFVAGTRLSHLGALTGMGLIGFSGLVAMAPYRLQRVTAFLDPWKDPLKTGYQIIQSLYAIGSGGVLGLGLGMSRQKYLVSAGAADRLRLFDSGRGARVPRRTFGALAFRSARFGADSARRSLRRTNSAPCSPPASPV